MLHYVFNHCYNILQRPIHRARPVPRLYCFHFLPPYFCKSYTCILKVNASEKGGYRLSGTRTFLVLYHKTTGFGGYTTPFESDRARVNNKDQNHKSLLSLHTFLCLNPRHLRLGSYLILFQHRLFPQTSSSYRL